MVLLGDSSYCLYIFHWIPLICMYYAGVRNIHLGLIGVVFSVVASVALSIVAFKYIETPLRYSFRSMQKKIDVPDKVSA